MCRLFGDMNISIVECGGCSNEIGKCVSGKKYLINFCQLHHNICDLDSIPTQHNEQQIIGCLSLGDQQYDVLWGHGL